MSETLTKCRKKICVHMTDTFCMHEYHIDIIAMELNETGWQMINSLIIITNS